MGSLFAGGERIGRNFIEITVDGQNQGMHLLPSFFNIHDSKALVAQSVEHILGKDEVGGSSPLEGSTFRTGRSFVGFESWN